jgi:hypothetical protein
MQQGNGQVWYVFNNVTWKAYGGGTIFGIDTNNGAAPTPSYFYFWNNSMYAPSGTQSCIDSGGAGAPDLAYLNISLYNNQCITTQSSTHWFSMKTGAANSVNGVTSPTNTTADSANLIMTPATAAAQGFTLAAALAPTQTYVSTLVPKGQDPSPCSGPSTALCKDVNQIARPAAGAPWGPGAYFNNSGKAPISPPVGVGATVK